MTKRTSPVVLLVVTVAVAAPARGTNYIRVTATANIRTEPNSSAQVVTKAAAGDVFEVGGHSGEWTEVYGPSTESRYVSSSLVEGTTKLPQFPTSEATLRQVCHEVVAAEDRAMHDAERRYPDPNFIPQINYQRLLHDRYELPILERYGIAPAQSAHLTAVCAQNRWF